MSWKVYVNRNKCDGCTALHNKWKATIHKDALGDITNGECVKVCPVEVFEMDSNNKSVPTGEQWCIGCQSCEDVCPTQAIEITYD